MMRKRAFAFMAPAIVAGLLLGACGSGDTTAGSSGSGVAPTKSEVAIGWVGQISGTQPCAECAGILNAWAEQVNHDGGLDGHPVKVVVKDDAGDPAKSLAAVKELVENDHVLAIVGPKVTGQEATWASYVEEHNVPVIGGGAYTGIWSSNPMFFASTTGRTAQVYSQVYAAKFAGASTYGLLYCQEAPACKEAVPHFAEIGEELGLGQGMATQISGSAASYTAQCVQIQQTGVGAVLMALAGQTTIRVATDCERQSTTATYVVPTGSILKQMASTPALDQAMASVSSFGWWQTDTPAQQEFQTLAESISGADPETTGATITFTAAKLFQQVFTAAAATSDSVTATELIDQLYQLKDETLGGLTPPLTFVEGQPKESACFYLAKINDGEFETQNDGQPVCVPASH